MRLRRAEEIEKLSYRTVVELNAESRLAPERRVATIARRPERTSGWLPNGSGGQRRQLQRSARIDRPAAQPQGRGMVADAR